MPLALIEAACMAPAQSPLAAAAARNDVVEIRRLLAEGDRPDDIGPGGVTALVAAARAGALDAIRALVDAGADVNRRDARSTRWPPLMHAIHTRQPEAVRLLLERGADPNRGSDQGFSPLLMAAADPTPDVAALLLAHGANPRVRSRLGVTPLTQAVSGGALSDIDRPLLGGCHPETVRALLAHDPGLRLGRDLGGLQARFWARLNGCDEVLELVQKR